MENASKHQIPEEPLSDLLLALEAAGGSFDVALESSAGRARISVRGGKLVDAEFGDKSGSDAVYSMLALRDGEYRLKENGADRPGAVPVSLSQIVHEQLKSTDLAAQLRSGSDLSVTAPLERTSQSLPKDLTPLALRALAMINGRLTALDVAAGLKSSPAETLATVRFLADAGLVRAVRAGTLALGTRILLDHGGTLPGMNRRPRHETETDGDGPEGAEGDAHSPSVPPREPVPARLAGRLRAAPVDTGYSSVPPPSLAEEKISHPTGFKSPLPLAYPEERAGEESFGQHEVGRMFGKPSPGVGDLDAADGGLDLQPLERERRDSDLGPDPAVVRAAAGQLTDSEMPLPSSRLGRGAISQLDELNQAVASSRHPKLPKLDDQEMSQTFTNSPGSVPLPENLPGEPREAERGLPVVGRYEILARLRRGGMGSVYMCRLSGNAGFRRLFAMKVLHGHLAAQSEALEAFFHEARVLGGLHHRNIVGIADVGSPTEPYIVLDYVEGGNLSELYRASPNKRDPGVILRIVLDALSALKAAHDAESEGGSPLGLVHCDVTPHNLLVGIDGTCRLTDFGIARTGDFDPVREVTRGKPGYIAPERLTRQGCDRRSDLFSLGVVLYSGLTGVEPFAAESAEATMKNILRATPAPPSSVGLRPPPALDWVCMRALAKDPAARYQSAEEMADELRRIAERENLLGSSSDVADWVQEAIAPTLAARRTASLRGTMSPEARYSTAPPPADYASVGSSAPPDAPSAAENTEPLDAPLSSRSFDEQTEILSSDVSEAARAAAEARRPLGLYILLALAMSGLVWVLLQPGLVNSILGGGSAQATTPENAAKTPNDQVDLSPTLPQTAEPDVGAVPEDQDRIVIPEIEPAKETP